MRQIYYQRLDKTTYQMVMCTPEEAKECKFIKSIAKKPWKKVYGLDRLGSIKSYKATADAKEYEWQPLDGKKQVFTSRDAAKEAVKKHIEEAGESVSDHEIYLP